MSRNWKAIMRFKIATGLKIKIEISPLRGRLRFYSQLLLERTPQKCRLARRGTYGATPFRNNRILRFLAAKNNTWKCTKHALVASLMQPAIFLNNWWRCVCYSRQLYSALKILKMMCGRVSIWLMKVSKV